MRLPQLERENELAPAKGCLIGLLLSVPLWAVILGVISWLM